MTLWLCESSHAAVDVKLEADVFLRDDHAAAAAAAPEPATIL